MKTSKKSLEYLPLNYTETGPINILSFHIIYEPEIPEEQKKNKWAKEGEEEREEKGIQKYKKSAGK